jgi:peroxiredoxin/outer membrane lipoprotein-sorting protein
MFRLAAFLCASCALAAEPEAADILKQVREKYARLTAIHLVATRHTEIMRQGLGATGDTDYEYASKAPGMFRAWMREEGVEALAVSDGATTWKALPKAKQWTKSEIAALPDEDEEQPSEGARQPRDMRESIGRALVSRYAAISRLAEDAEYLKDDTCNLGAGKVPCYVLRARVGQQKYDLWVDKRRLLIVRDVQSGLQSTEFGPVQARIETRCKRLEVNGEVPDSVFGFTPDPKWKEVEMLVLPLDQRLSLVGLTAADFTLKSLDGESRRLSDFRGKVVVVDFWATWCPPCRRELPVLQKLRADYAGKVEFVGVGDEDARTLREFLKSKHYEMETLVDGKREVHRQYGVRAIPTMLIIDPQGVIRQHFIGSRGEAEMRKAIQAVLGT